MKLQGIKDINWLMYKQYCWRNGLSEGQFKNLKTFLEGGDKLAGYKKVTKEDAEVFLKLYEKYLLMKLDDMKNILKTLPTNIIERCFNGVEFFDKDFDVSKLDEATFGVGGLCGWSKIKSVVEELEFYKRYDDTGELDDFMEKRGFKVKRKSIGILGI